MSQDIVIDSLQALAEVLRKAGAQVLPGHLAEAERRVKADWGGDRVYIPKTGEDTQRQISARDRAIRRDFQRGDHPPVLSSRYNLTVRRIRQILSLDAGCAVAPVPQVPATETACLIGFPGAAHDRQHDDAHQRADRTDGRRHRQVAKGAA